LWPNVSKIGLSRPIARYAAPSSAMNFAGFSRGAVVEITFTVLR
jgi:hypothetical protein